MHEIIMGYQGEMSLKGLNRNQFESAMMKILRYRLKTVGKFKVYCTQSTFYMEPEEEDIDMDLAFDRVRTVFGLAALSRAVVCEKDFDTICQTAEDYLGDSLHGIKTFKVEARRSDKTYPMTSPELMRELGAYLLGKHNYLLTLVKSQSARTQSAYIYCSAGYGESSTDLVFGGNGLIVESGRMLRRTERFSTEEQLIVADIDTEKLLNSRRRTTTFAPHRPAERIIVEIPLPENPANVTLDREFNSHPFVPQTPEEMDESGREIINIQTMGLAQRLQHTDCKKVVIGVSGGLDSTLALLIAVRTFDRLGLDRKGIIGVTMPGFGTSNRTYRNSIALMRCLGITSREISIRKACEQHFADIGLNPEEQSSAYENAQARERTQILMDIANMEHGMVLGTGDLSELALGWATYNGDQMSMYGLNASLPKTLIQVLLRWMAQVCQDDAIRETLLDVVATPISPELLPSGEEGGIAQHTEKLVGPYELHDFFLYHFIQNGYSPAKILFAAETAFDGRYDRATILRWMRVFFQRFFSQQFKRSAMPDGPKVGIISLSPRGDWRMPSDATATLWLREIDLLIQEK